MFLMKQKFAKNSPKFAPIFLHFVLWSSDLMLPLFPDIQEPPARTTVWQSTAGLRALPIITAYRGLSVLTSGGGDCVEWVGVCLCKKVGCLLARSPPLYLPHRAYSTGTYGSIGLTVRERSDRVEGHEIGVSGEAISLLTPRARGWPSLHHRSAVGTHPHCLPLDYNRSNYYSLLATVAEPDRGKKEPSHQHQ